MKHAPLILFLIFALALQPQMFAQQQQPPPLAPRPSPTPPVESSQDDTDVVRITTNLVQIDAVVTDRNGRQVTDLRAEDFEILENNRPQAITNFSYVSLAPAGAANNPTTATTRNADRNAVAPPPPARLRPEQVRRTIALVVDDLGLSFESVHFVRRALRRFVDEQMQPGDLVAIIRTRAGAGALQQFTADRQQLYAAIERVRWFPLTRGGGVAAFSPLNPLESMANQTTGEGADRDRSGMPEVNELREEIYTIGTLGALNFVVRGMRELPGRKAVVMMSDGFPILNREGLSSRVMEQLNNLTELANRASVVFYTIDARGLQTFAVTAADDTGSVSPTTGEPRGMRPDETAQLTFNRGTEFFESQNGLNYLAQRTGGFMVANNNDIGGGIRRVLEDQRGYYLIGYRPDEETFDPRGGRRFRSLQVRVRNRPELRVRTRSGFYSVTDEAARPVARRTRGQQLVSAISSPFATGGINVRLSSLFGNEARAGSFMRSMLHINARDLTFTPEADGWQRTVIDVLAVTFGENGQVIDEVNRTETIRVRPAAFERIQGEGFVYLLNVPVRQSGAYQLRVAVRDAATERIGSANQFVEVPNLNRNRLTLSGIIMIGREATTRAGNSSATGENENLDGDSVRASAALRRFRTGTMLDYGYVIYNARTDRAARQPQLTTEVRLFRDGQQIFAGQPQAIDTSGQTDMERLNVGGRLQLGTGLPPGEYVLQVIVTDTLVRNARQRIATQWIDFEIVE
jgi:VWFA-related protein